MSYNCEDRLENKKKNIQGYGGKNAETTILLSTVSETVSFIAAPLGIEDGNYDFVYMCLCMCTCTFAFIHICTLVPLQLVVMSSLSIPQT